MFECTNKTCPTRSTPPHTWQDIPLPRHLSGAILGPGGSTVARLRRESGAKLHLVKTPPGNPVQVRDLRVTGGWGSPGAAAGTSASQSSCWHRHKPRPLLAFWSIGCSLRCCHITQVLEVEGVYEQVSRCVALVTEFFAVEAPREQVTRGDQRRHSSATFCSAASALDKSKPGAAQ